MSARMGWVALQASDFWYELPEDAIAQEAIEPRDAARLLIASTLEDRTFRDLPDLLRPEDLLIVNRTRVRAARLFATKEGTGGRVEVLLTRRIDALRWEALVRPARRLRAGTALEIGPVRGAIVEDPVRGVTVIELRWPDGDVEDLLPSLGEMPLPPYFHGHLDDPDRYQTIFAKTTGSAAAPTAALHFTPGLVEAVARRGIAIAEVDLDVGLDTFRPMDDGPVDAHVMHRERYEVPAATVESVESARSAGGRVVAVGTTVVRALEDSATTGELVAGPGEASIFIRPGHRFNVVDAVVTNFHAPGTTLLVMIAAMLGPRWPDVYEHALRSRYRFLSFGDAMFIEVHR